VSLPPLATQADATGYGYTLDPATADALLNRASVRIRRAAGQPITPSVVTVRLTPDGDRLRLPAPPVIEIQSVKSVVDDVATDLTGWWWDGERLRLPDCTTTLAEVTYQRGWTTLPGGLVELTCQVADRLAKTPVGMDAGIRAREVVGEYSETYAAEQTQTAGDLLPGELTALRRELGGQAEYGAWVVSL